MKEKCKGTKKNGEPCTAWAMANGYDHRHGGKVVADQETTESELEKLVAEEITVAETSVEIETCGAITAKRTPCKLRAEENAINDGHPKPINRLKKKQLDFTYIRWLHVFR